MSNQEVLKIVLVGDGAVGMDLSQEVQYAPILSQKGLMGL